MMNISAIITDIGSFVSAVGSNSVLSSVVILLIVGVIGGLAFSTIKRFVK